MFLKNNIGIFYLKINQVRAELEQLHCGNSKNLKEQGKKIHKLLFKNALKNIFDGGSLRLSTQKLLKKHSSYFQWFAHKMEDKDKRIIHT